MKKIEEYLAREDDRTKQLHCVKGFMDLAESLHMMANLDLVEAARLWSRAAEHFKKAGMDIEAQ